MKLLGVPEEVTNSGASALSCSTPDPALSTGTLGCLCSLLPLTGHLSQPRASSPAPSRSVLVTAVISSKSQHYIISHQNYTMNLLKLWPFSRVNIRPLSHLWRVKKMIPRFSTKLPFSQRKSLYSSCVQIWRGEVPHSASGRFASRFCFIREKAHPPSPLTLAGAETRSVVLENVPHSESGCFPAAFFIPALCKLVN